MSFDQKPDYYYTNVRQEMVDFLPRSAKTLLDVGCGEGYFASYIKDKFGTEVWGIEMAKGPASIAETKLDKVLIGECENRIQDIPDNYLDVIYFNDVLEHMIDPYQVLSAVKSKLSNSGVIISSIPNVRYHRVLKNLLISKNWEYEKDGVLDKTHLRFFTGKSILKMYRDLGYTVIAHQGINRTKSIKPYFYNIPFLFTSMDIFYNQFATVAGK